MRKTKPTDIGLNRTGLAASPIDSLDLIQPPLDEEPDIDLQHRALKLVRGSYQKGSEPIGTMPPPASLREAIATIGSGLTGRKATVLTDRLGQRLAFERTGSRLYDALIQKFRTLGVAPGGPTIEDLVAIRDEELDHFHLVKGVIESMGSDPTVQTPAADVAAVMTQGVLQVVLDPRTTRSQCLEAVLLAENADVEGWALLVELMRDLGSSKIAKTFAAANMREEEHALRVRTWLSVLVERDGGANARPATRAPRKVIAPRTAKGPVVRAPKKAKRGRRAA